MTRDQLSSRVSALISQLDSLRMSLIQARTKELELVSSIAREEEHVSYLEGELARLDDDLQQALADEAYEDDYDDNLDDNNN